jgi:hypothetical protein
LELKEKYIRYLPGRQKGLPDEKIIVFSLPGILSHNLYNTSILFLANLPAVPNLRDEPSGRTFGRQRRQVSDPDTHRGVKDFFWRLMIFVPPQAGWKLKAFFFHCPSQQQPCLLCFREASAKQGRQAGKKD